MPKLPQNGLPHNGSSQGAQPHNGLPQNGPPQNGLPHTGLPHNALPQNAPPPNGQAASEGLRPAGPPPRPAAARSRSPAVPARPGLPLRLFRSGTPGAIPRRASRTAQRGRPAGPLVPSARAWPLQRTAAGGRSSAPPPPVSVTLTDAVQAAHVEGFGFGEAVARDAPALWLEAVLARKPRMPSDLEARLLQGSALPIDSLLHDEVRHALRRGFWDALERSRR